MKIYTTTDGGVQLVNAFQANQPSVQHALAYEAQVVTNILLTRLNKQVTNLTWVITGLALVNIVARLLS